MADKNEAKVVLEREYNVPLRRKFINIPKYKRAKKAVNTLREFIVKHMKSENVKIDSAINVHIWKDGMRNPPHHVAVIAKKDSEDVVSVELKGAKKKEKVDVKVEKPAEKVAPKTETKTEAPKAAEKPAEPKAEAKPEVKAEPAKAPEKKAEKPAPKKE